ncbi:histidinol-phosphate transaminase [Streptomyces sp. NBC_01352]|uniref:histidinol-phosphate transaminase n=1 Tax=unclassified Streptomyces TaxID=2593676 RepID=UPI002E31DE65|nr:histidinol-phosphate transaminase [Streptomyces sp. NBC_01352]
MPESSSTRSVRRSPALRTALSAIPPYAPGRRASSDLTAALASNESHFAPLPSVQQVVQNAARTVNRYPDMTSTRLREEIGAFLQTDPGHIAVSPGSVGALQQLMTSFCDEGDEVVFAWRSFEAYPILVRLAGARPVPVPLTADEEHDLDAMAAAITDRTRMVLLCVPNNPTGVGMTQADLVAFLDRVPPTVLVVVDEAYAEYVDSPGHAAALSLLDERSNVCVLRTFSKAYGLAGLRVGYAVGPAHVADGLRRAALPFGVSAPAQEAAIASLAAAGELHTRVTALVRERRRVVDAVRDQGWSVPDSQANFFWLRANGRPLSRLLTAFDDAEILVRPFADEGIRVTLADRATNDRVLRVLSDVRRGAAL